MSEIIFKLVKKVLSIICKFKLRTILNIKKSNTVYEDIKVLSNKKYQQTLTNLKKIWMYLTNIC